MEDFFRTLIHRISSARREYRECVCLVQYLWNVDTIKDVVKQMQREIETSEYGV